MSAEHIQQIELNILQAKALIAHGEALRRLSNNKDFKAIIREGYLKDEAIRLVHLKGAPSRQSAQEQAEIVKEIDGIGALMGYFQVIEHRAMLAEQAIAADEETLSELESEAGSVA